jgi:hypothetical protein
VLLCELLWIMQNVNKELNRLECVYLLYILLQDILNISTQLFNFLILILIVNIQHDDWILDDIFINKYILDECTYC